MKIPRFEDNPDLQKIAYDFGLVESIATDLDHDPRRRPFFTETLHLGRLRVFYINAYNPDEMLGSRFFYFPDRGGSTPLMHFSGGETGTRKIEYQHISGIGELAIAQFRPSESENVKNYRIILEAGLKPGEIRTVKGAAMVRTRDLGISEETLVISIFGSKSTLSAGERSEVITSSDGQTASINGSEPVEIPYQLRDKGLAA